MANFHVIAGPDETLAHPTVRRIGTADIRYALRKGFDDFMAMPTHLIFLGLIYPLFGIGLGALTFSKNALPLLFPLVSGFALWRQLGGYVALMMAISALATLTVLPALALLVRPRFLGGKRVPRTAA